MLTDGSFKSEPVSDFNEDSRDSVIRSRSCTPIKPSPLTIKSEQTDEEDNDPNSEQKVQTGRLTLRLKVPKPESDSPRKRLKDKFEKEKGQQIKNKKKCKIKDRDGEEEENSDTDEQSVNKNYNEQVKKSELVEKDIECGAKNTDESIEKNELNEKESECIIENAVDNNELNEKISECVTNSTDENIEKIEISEKDNDNREVDPKNDEVDGLGDVANNAEIVQVKKETQSFNAKETTSEVENHENNLSRAENKLTLDVEDIVTKSEISDHSQDGFHTINGVYNVESSEVSEITESEVSDKVESKISNDVESKVSEPKILDLKSDNSKLSSFDSVKIDPVDSDTDKINCHTEVAESTTKENEEFADHSLLDKNQSNSNDSVHCISESNLTMDKKESEDNIKNSDLSEKTDEPEACKINRTKDMSSVFDKDDQEKEVPEAIENAQNITAESIVNSLDDENSTDKRKSVLKCDRNDMTSKTDNEETSEDSENKHEDNLLQETSSESKSPDISKEPQTHNKEVEEESETDIEKLNMDELEAQHKQLLDQKIQKQECRSQTESDPSESHVEKSHVEISEPGKEENLIKCNVKEVDRSKEISEISEQTTENIPTEDAGNIDKNLKENSAGQNDTNTEISLEDARNIDRNLEETVASPKDIGTKVTESDHENNVKTNVDQTDEVSEGENDIEKTFSGEDKGKQTDQQSDEKGLTDPEVSVASDNVLDATGKLSDITEIDDSSYNSGSDKLMSSEVVDDEAGVAEKNQTNTKESAELEQTSGCKVSTEKEDSRNDNAIYPQEESGKLVDNTPKDKEAEHALGDEKKAESNEKCVESETGPKTDAVASPKRQTKVAVRKLVKKTSKQVAEEVEKDTKGEEEQSEKESSSDSSEDDSSSSESSAHLPKTKMKGLLAHSRLSRGKALKRQVCNFSFVYFHDFICLLF